VGIAELFEKHPCKADIISPNAAAELLGVDLMELESLTTERCPERNLPVIILWGRKFYRRSDVTWWKAEQLAAHPGAAERKEIADLFSRADHAEHNPRYQDYALACALRAEARGRLHTWSKRYPAEWTEERAAELRVAAEHSRDLAAGARVYDCDGSLSEDDRERRAAEFEAEAEKLEALAAEMK